VRQKRKYWASFLESPLNNGFILLCVWNDSTKIVLKWRDLLKLCVWLIVVIIGLKVSLSSVQGQAWKFNSFKHVNIFS
jgi:hypothetical protein